MFGSPDLPPPRIEEQARVSQDDEATTFQLKTADALRELKDALQLTEGAELTDNVTLGKQIDYLSTPGSIAREVLLNGKKVGVLVKFETQPGLTPKAMFMNVHRSPDLFTKKTLSNGEQFLPNIPAIKKYFENHSNTPGNKKREITMITTGPTFEEYSQSTMTGIAYDNGEFVGSEKLLTDPETKSKGIAYVTGGRLTLSHTKELSQAKIDELVGKKADIVTMSSLKRDNLPLNDSPNLRSHPNGHYLVQYKDGSTGVLILKGTAVEKKAVIGGLTDISRVLYSDAWGVDNHLDGMRIQTQDGLKYSHPDKGDIFMNPKVKEPLMVENNMPGIIIFYSEEN